MPYGAYVHFDDLFLPCNPQAMASWEGLWWWFSLEPINCCTSCEVFGWRGCRGTRESDLFIGGENPWSCFLPGLRINFIFKCLKAHTQTCTLYTCTHLHVYILLIDFNCASSSALELWEGLGLGGRPWLFSLYFAAFFKQTKCPTWVGQRMLFLSDYADEKYSLDSCLLSKCLGSVLMIYDKMSYVQNRYTRLQSHSFLHSFKLISYL